MRLMEVTYDEDGQRVYWRDGEQVSEDEWMLQHPHMKVGNSGRNSGTNPNGGVVGAGDQSGSGGDDPEVIRQGIRDERAKVRAQVEQSRSSGDGVGRAEERPERA